jgi:hypothetical protein
MVERDAEHQRVVAGRLAKIKHARGDVMRAENRLRGEVKRARAAGATWKQVGEALGITQQGAQKRYGDPEERETAERLRQTERALRRARKRLLTVSLGDDPDPE